jgi:uncharacterized coiled-coil DUF342 family protein
MSANGLNKHAHDRLEQAYVHTGQKDKAQEQFHVQQQRRAQHKADLGKQIVDIRQIRLLGAGRKSGEAMTVER